MHCDTRLPFACACAVAASAACGSNDLQPIRDPPGSDAAVADGSGASDGGGEGRGPADSGADGGGTLCKRGIAETAGPSAALAPTASSPGVSWWYNWSSQDPGGDPRVEFVPMLW